MEKRGRNNYELRGKEFKIQNSKFKISVVQNLKFLLLLLFCGCNGGSDAPFLKVDKTEFVFSAQAKSERVACSASAKIQVSSTQSWCTATVVDNDKTIVIYASRNDEVGSQQRTATITVTAGEATPVQLKVTQNSPNGEFSVEGNTDLQINWRADQRSIRVKTNIDFTAVSSAQSWCTTEIKEGADYNLIIKMDENFTGAERTANVTVGALGFNSVTIKISQKNFPVFSPNKFVIKNGVNISEWLLESNQRGYFTRLDMEYLAGLGFDHVRIPICEWQMFSETGKKDEEAWALLESALAWCAELNMRAIVDFHRPQVYPYPSQPATCERFYDVWRKISAQLKKYPIGLVAYEILNEPGYLPSDNQYAAWNTLSTACFNVIRELEPERMIMLGSAGANGAWEAQYLNVPDDPNVMITVHFYTPFQFTHYKGSWLGAMANVTFPVHYPGATIAPADRAKAIAELNRNDDTITEEYNNSSDLEARFNWVKAKATATGKKIWVGEYGCSTNAPMPDRLIWHQHMNEIYERTGIARCYWEYQHHRAVNDGFGLKDKNGEANTAVINAILGKN